MPNDKERVSKLSELQDRLQSVDGELGGIEGKLLNLSNAIMDTASEETRKVFVKSADALSAGQSNLEKEKQGVQSQIDQLLSNEKNIEEQLKIIRELIYKIKELEGQERIELRLNLRSQLRRLIRGIRIGTMNIAIFF